MAMQLTSNYKIYPNPASDFLQLESSQKARVSIFDLTGKLRAKTSIEAGTNTFDISTLSTGIYLIEIEAVDSITPVLVSIVKSKF